MDYYYIQYHDKKHDDYMVFLLQADGYFNAEKKAKDELSKWPDCELYSVTWIDRGKVAGCEMVYMADTGRDALERECERLRGEVAEYEGIEGRCSVGHNKRFTYELKGNVGCVACERDEARSLLPRVAEAVRSACHLKARGALSPLQASRLIDALDVSAIIEQVTGEPIENPLTLADVLTVIHSVAAQYPTDIFPDDGETLDCKGAKMARLTCANIERELKEFIAETATRAGEAEEKK